MKTVGYPLFGVYKVSLKTALPVKKSEVDTIAKCTRNAKKGTWIVWRGCPWKHRGRCIGLQDARKGMSRMEMKRKGSEDGACNFERTHTAAD